MSSKPSHFRVGLFALLGIAILVSGLVAFGLRGAFEKKMRFETAIPGDVEGLAIGSQVLFRGVPVGQVTNIDFAWNEYPSSKLNYLILRFEVRQNIFPGMDEATFDRSLAQGIKEGIRARIKSQGITGTSVVFVEKVEPAGLSEIPIDYQPHDRYIPSAPSQLGQILTSIQNTVGKLEKLELTETIKRLNSLLESVEGLAGDARKIRFGELSAQVASILSEVRDLTQKISSVADSADDEVRSLKLAETRQAATDLLRDLQKTTEHANKALDRVGQLDVEGLNDMLTATRRAVEDLDRLIDQVNQYPAGALFGMPPAPPGSVKKEEK